MEKKETIEIVARLLEEVTSTDACAIKVIANDESLDILPDKERRRKDGYTGMGFGGFHHMEEVVDICRVFHLNSFVSGRIDRDGDLAFYVHIF